jgi:hypothetical protein
MKFQKNNKLIDVVKVSFVCERIPSVNRNAGVAVEVMLCYGVKAVRV